jgi:hypothetical protein
LHAGIFRTRPVDAAGDELLPRRIYDLIVDNVKAPYANRRRRTLRGKYRSGRLLDALGHCSRGTQIGNRCLTGAATGDRRTEKREGNDS